MHVASLLYRVKTSWDTPRLWGCSRNWCRHHTHGAGQGSAGWPTVKPVQNPVQGPQREAPVELEVQTPQDRVGLQHSPISYQLTWAWSWNKAEGLCKFWVFILHCNQCACSKGLSAIFPPIILGNFVHSTLQYWCYLKGPCSDKFIWIIHVEKWASYNCLFLHLCLISIHPGRG